MSQGVALQCDRVHGEYELMLARKAPLSAAALGSSLLDSAVA